MSYTAIVAVHPDVEAEFVDENAMAEMPLPLQQAIKGRAKGQMKKLAKVGVDWELYIVWGSAEGLAEAEERWTTNIEVMATWDADTGLRAGQIHHTTVDDTDPDNPIYTTIIVGTPLRPLHAELMGLLPDRVTYDADRNETGRLPAIDFSSIPIVLGHKPREL